MTISRNLSFLAEGASSTGVLGVPNGGTGLNSLTAGYIPYGNGTSAFSSSSNLYFDGTNLGIGTTSPASKLNVSNSANSATSITVTNSNGGASALANIKFNNGTSTGEFGQLSTSYAGYGVLVADATYIYAGNNRPITIATDSNYIAFGNGAGATERMRIDSSGNLLVGTTSNSGNSRVNISQASNNDEFVINNTLTTGFSSSILTLGSFQNTSNSTYNFFQCVRQGAAVVLYVRDSGNVVNANNSYGAISDIKLKENIVDATPKLDDLLKVKVRQYNLKDDQNKLKQIGVVAQELEEVFAGLVEETVDKDAEGSNLGTTTKSVKYSVFVPILIKAIQELNAKFDAYAASHP